MNICVVGTGYVGLVVGACMSDLGFRVVCVDREEAKIDLLNSGGVPIYEPGLREIIERNTRDGRLSFTTDGARAVAEADVAYIAVGTPGKADGSADISGVLAVARLIGKNMARPMVVVIKSTVPVGTADQVREALSESSAHEFDVVSNPEFLKEGAAIDDFSRPDRIVIGCRTDRAREVMRDLYNGLVRKGRPIYFMDNRSAELTKYAANAMLATKISFMNELSRLCDLVGADVESVREGTGSDSRIGPRFLFAGVGYGGSCFPKDVRALVDTARQVGLELQIGAAVERVNMEQKSVLSNKVIKRFGEDLRGRHFAVWGLAFKPETDDMRDAPAVVIVERLLAAGATVTAYDPEATETARAVLGDSIGFAATALEAAESADALLVITEWKQFRNPDFRGLSERMASRVIFDGRNLYEPTEVREAGFEYFGIGRQ